MLVFEGQRIVVSKNGMYVGKGYAQNNMWKMNVIAIHGKDKVNENASTSTYMLESSNLWHVRLGHVNFDSLRLYPQI